VINTFGGDEPIKTLLDAARCLPTIEWEITGDLRRSDPAEVASAPGNVRFLGYLNEHAYLQALTSCGGVLVLTTDRTSVPRSACEAVWAGRPLVLSASEATRDYFPHAIHVENTPSSVASGVERLVAEYGTRIELTANARVEQWNRWEDQLEALEELVGRAPGDARSH
jgi:glycosyltransferase involved in cell wall biosynthesis